MKRTNPVLIIIFLAVCAMGMNSFIRNGPNKKYSSQQFWKTATVEDVQTIPEVALQRGNKNGPVLMWAATATEDPAVITALVRRGADVNEPDTGAFTGTPLSAAAGYNKNPEIIDKLVSLGAKIDMPVGSNDKTPLIIAAEINPEPHIIEALIKNGASTTYQDKMGLTALKSARMIGAPAVVEVLERYSQSQ